MWQAFPRDPLRKTTLLIAGEDYLKPAFGTFLIQEAIFYL